MLIFSHPPAGRGQAVKPSSVRLEEGQAERPSFFRLEEGQAERPSSIRPEGGRLKGLPLRRQERNRPFLLP